MRFIAINKLIMNIITITYYLLVRVFLHLVFGSVFYLAILKIVKISRWQFGFLVLLPIAILMEWYQHRMKVADSVNQFILVRDSVVLIGFIVSFFVLSLLKNYFSPDKLSLGLIILVVGGGNSVSYFGAFQTTRCSLGVEACY